MTAKASREPGSRARRAAWIGLFAGPLLALLCFLTFPESYRGAGGEVVALNAGGRATVAVMVWMGVWWLTEAIEIYATALLPLVVFPWFGVAGIRETAAPYASPLVFLFLGGFLVALALSRWDLDQRIALGILRRVGTRPPNLVAGFMVATAFLSAFVSNTATAAMMLPIALSVLELLRRSGKSASARPVGRRLATAMMLGVAYGASIGGMATLVGSPPNGFVAQFVESTFDEPVGFLEWLRVGAAPSLVLLPITWLLLTRVVFRLDRAPLPGAREVLEERYRGLGPLSRGERLTAVVFALMVAGWLFRPLLTRLVPALSDPGIAMTAGVALFVIPVELRSRTFILAWRDTRKLPWGVLLLFGGGLSLAAAVERNGVAEFLGSQTAGLQQAPLVLSILVVTAGIVFLTELTSNTATTATLVPVLAALAPGLGVHPYLLVFPATLGASCAFMLPVATPPNAIVFGSGYLRIGDMVRTGFWLNLIAIVVITALSMLLLPHMYG